MQRLPKMPGNRLSLFAPDDAATSEIGAVLADWLAGGDVVTLEGDLGAGKTALARAIIRARLGDPAMDVPSPSFALVQPYPGIVHADLYRLSDEDEIEELGLFDDDDAILLVEWPNRAPSLFQRPGLTVALSIPKGGAGRNLDLTSRAGREIGDLPNALSRWTIPK